MAQLTWEAMNPIDTSRYLDAIQRAQAQSLAGVEQIGNAYKGYYDNLKKQNTNDMLTALNQAQNPEQLAAARANIAAMQQRWGSGYDMDAVRTAMDERPVVLMERASKALQYQQEKARYEAIPQINEAAAKFSAGRKGVTPEMVQQLNTLAALGIDASGTINSLATSANSDYVNERNFANEDYWKTKKFNQGAYEFGANLNQRKGEFNQTHNLAAVKAAWEMGKDAFGADQSSGAGNTYVAADGTEFTTGGGAIAITNYASKFMPSGVRGIRNNNPGNINFYNQPGASLERKGGRFARFSTPEQGINAMSKQLDLYYTGKSRNVTKPINTIQDIITTWAPPYNDKGEFENRTADYIDFVAKSMGVSPTAKLNLRDPNTKAALMSAMITQENGSNPYTREQYIAGITGNVGNTPANVPLVGIDRKVQQKIRGEYQNAMLKYNEGLALKDQPVNVGNVLAGLTAKEKGSAWTQDAFDIVNALKDNPQLKGLSAEGITNVYNRAKAWQSKPGVPFIGYNSSDGLKKSIDNIIKDEIGIDAKRKEHIAKASHPSNIYAQKIQQAFEANGVSISAKEALLHIDPARYQALYGKPAVKVQEAVDKKVEKVAATAKPETKPTPKPTAAAVDAAAKPKPAVNAESTKAAETAKQAFKPNPLRPYDSLVLNFSDPKTKAEFTKKVEDVEKKAAQARKATEAAKKAQKLREEAVEKRKVADTLVKRAREEAARKAEEELRIAKFQQEREARLHPAPSDEWLKSAKERLKQNR